MRPHPGANPISLLLVSTPPRDFFFAAERFSKSSFPETPHMVACADTVPFPAISYCKLRQIRHHWVIRSSAGIGVACTTHNFTKQGFFQFACKLIYSPNRLASHAGVLRGTRFSSNELPYWNDCVGGYEQTTFWLKTESKPCNFSKKPCLIYKRG